MHLVPCENNQHFYDSDKYEQCPHCTYIVESDFVWSLYDLNSKIKYKFFEEHKQIDLSELEHISSDDIRGGQMFLGETKYFGSQNDCDIAYENKYVSRKHFKIYSVKYQLGQIVDYFIVDLGSMNGTWLNGEKLEPNKPYKLSSNDSICVAGIYKFKITIEIIKNNFEYKLKNSLLINEKSNLYMNIVEHIEDCGNNPFTQGRVHGKLVYQEPLKNLAFVEDLIVSVKEINDKYQVLIFYKNHIMNGYEADGIIGIDEILTFKIDGVLDAFISYDFIITKGKREVCPNYDLINLILNCNN